MGLRMVNINRLTYLTFELISLVDSGKSMSVKETKKLCEEKRIFEELERRFPIKEAYLDLSLLKPEMREEIATAFQDMALAIDEKRKFGIENNGLCLLIAYAQEQIQRENRKE
jgi:hypothetical protein